MKLLFVVDGFATSNLLEPSVWIAAVLTHWVERGHEVDVLCTQPLPASTVPESIPGANMRRPAISDLELALGDALGRTPDVVHVASSAPFGPRIVEALQGLPILVDVHDFWPICPNHDLLRRPRHESCGEHFPHASCAPCAGFAKLRETEERLPLLRSARAIVAHSSFARVRLNAGIGRVVESIGYGVDTARFRPDPPPPPSLEIAQLLAGRDKPRILWLGPPTLARGREHLMDLLVALHSRVPEMELVVAGLDPDSPDVGEVLMLEASHLGLESRLKLYPNVTGDDLPALFASCKVAVTPAPGADPGGLFVLASLASGVPVVSTALGAPEDYLRHGDQAVLVAPGDFAGIATACAALLSDHDLRARMSVRARRSVERHSFGETLDALLDLYGRVASETRQRSIA